MWKIKRDINQQDFKIVPIVFVFFAFFINTLHILNMLKNKRDNNQQYLNVKSE